MERWLLAPLVLFPFAVMALVVYPAFPGTTTVFASALLTYGLRLVYEQLTSAAGAESMERFVEQGLSRVTSGSLRRDAHEGLSMRRAHE